MSHVHTFFLFAAGLKDPLAVPVGTHAGIVGHVAEVEAALGLEREPGMQHWKRNTFEAVSDEVLCETARAHNGWLEVLYERFEKWSKSPVEGGETITPEQAQEFWHGLQMIDVPVGRWTREYYIDRMETAYEVMRGRPTDGISFDEKALTPKQAGAVVWLFERWLDRWQADLQVCEGRDWIATSGDYDWCSTCGKAFHYEDVDGRMARCRRKGCELKSDHELHE